MSQFDEILVSRLLAVDIRPSEGFGQTTRAHIRKLARTVLLRRYGVDVLQAYLAQSHTEDHPCRVAWAHLFRAIAKANRKTARVRHSVKRSRLTGDDNDGEGTVVCGLHIVNLTDYV
jgi:hypothetical protein